MECKSRSAKKSRGGCGRCKQRRIKCDETRPTCRMCRMHRAECPGYERPLKWLAKHQQHLPSLHNEHGPSRDSSQAYGLANSASKTSTITSESSCTDGETLSPHGSLTHASPDAHDGTSPDASLWPSIDAWDFEDLGLFNVPFIEPTGTAQQFDAGFDLDSFCGSSHPYPNQCVASTEPQLIQNQSVVLPEQAVSILEPRESSQQTTSTGRNRFLETYYRLGRDLGILDQDFVNHYFQNVCSIFSCFDSGLNPFRYLVAELYPNSATIHLAIQSMAIGHLSNFYPQLASLGLQKRSQAWQLLQRDLYSHRFGKTPTDTVLLSLLLLGLSSSWHQTSNTAMQYLLVARNTVLESLQGSVSERHPARLRNEDFFQNCLMYWEMLASFIDPVPITPLPGKLDPPKATTPASSQHVVPHPWTGLLTDVNYALAEVGRILQRQRAQVRVDCYRDEVFCRSEKEWASYLEHFIRSLTVPTEEDVADFGDPRTPKIDLVLAAEAYRMIGLLELYAIFPHLLPKDEQQISYLDERFGKESKLRTAYKSDVNARLVSIAIHILDLIKPIAISSAACRLLPLVFVACSSYLRFPDLTSALSEYRGEEYEMIVQARSLVEARILVMSRKYPQRPVLQMLLIVKEVWQRLDDGNESAHWMETMHEKGWQTLMG